MYRYLSLGNVLVGNGCSGRRTTLGVGGCDVVTHHHHMATSLTNTHTRAGYWLLVTGYWLLLAVGCFYHFPSFCL